MSENSVGTNILSYIMQPSSSISPVQRTATTTTTTAPPSSSTTGKFRFGFGFGGRGGRGGRGARKSSHSRSPPTIVMAGSSSTTSVLLTASNAYTPTQMKQILGWSITIAIVIQLMQQFSGINSVFYYSTDTLKKAGLQSPLQLWLGTVLIATANFVAVLIPVQLMDKIGRKTLLLIWCTVCRSVCVVCVGVVGDCVNTLSLSLSLKVRARDFFLPLLQKVCENSKSARFKYHLSKQWSKIR